MLFSRQARETRENSLDGERMKAFIEEEVSRRLEQEMLRRDAERELELHLEKLRKDDGAEAMLPAENGDADTATKDTETAAMEGVFQALLEQAGEIRRWWPEFDLEREMQDPLFSVLAAGGYPLARIVAFVYPDRARAQALMEAEEEILGRIRSRNLRPATIGHANVGANTAIDVSALSDEQIGAIDRRVRRGERIVL